MRTWNRMALVVVPRQRFLDWLRSVDDTNADLTLAEVSREPTVYLLPECGSDPDAADLLADACDEILEDQFNSWYQQPALWPRDRGIESFQRWFSISFHSMIVDLCDDPLVAEEC